PEQHHGAVKALGPEGLGRLRPGQSPAYDHERRHCRLPIAAATRSTLLKRWEAARAPRVTTASQASRSSQAGAGVSVSDASWSMMTRWRCWSSAALSQAGWKTGSRVAGAP